MASKPGILTDWPWKSLGSFKYVILAPWMVHTAYLGINIMEGSERELHLAYLLVIPLALIRMLHNQIWISLSRHRTAKGKTRILHRPLEFHQVDRESNWDDQILFASILFYIGYTIIPWAAEQPVWKTDGVVITALLHAGPVELVYYWFHRALHHHFLYSRYHSHHHSSIVTEPISSIVHPFAEHIAYAMLFAVPILTTVLTKTSSMASLYGYVLFIDFMNNLGHCNFELIPKSFFATFPPLKYLLYTPSFHSLHHTQFRTNYSLFMPFYDYIYGTMDKSSDTLYETSLEKGEDSPDVVHLTHLTKPDSIYQLRLGFASVASHPYVSKWYLRMLWPITWWSAIITSISGQTFVLESNKFKNLNLQTWSLPRYIVQYFLPWQREAISRLIEESILDADRNGVKVVSLGLLNQGKELNKNGEIYVQRHPELKTKVVDGSSLVVAVVLNSIPKGATQVLLRGNLTKVAYAIAKALCQKGIQVATLHKNEYNMLSQQLQPEYTCNLVLSKCYGDHKIWLVGEGWAEVEQMNARKETLFIPFSHFPPNKLRKDCFYHTTPAMTTPLSFKNIHSCENWLPRRVMSAWRIAGILHALEGWNIDECGDTIFNIDEIWRASLHYGFQPLEIHHPIPQIQGP